MSRVNDEIIVEAEIAIQLEQSRANDSERCVSGAPFICIPKEGGLWVLVQGCCNSWQCPRCGQIRARKEYGRIVEGAKELSGGGHSMYFLTLTCRGRDMEVKEAEEKYMEWTNRLLTAARTKASREGQKWAYVQVTERQDRGHPHSHVLTTFVPSDAVLAERGAILQFEVEGTIYGYEARHQIIYSDWLWAQAVKSGLGSMTDLSIVDNPLAVASYISKYLFKDATKTVFPPHWRRVRYSHTYPKLPAMHVDGAFPVVRSVDWRKVATMDAPIITRERVTLEAAFANQVYNVLYTGKD